MCNLILITLIKNFKNRDMTAFTQIYEQFEGLILFYARKLGGEDYAQELTLFLLELLYSIKPESFNADHSIGIKKYISVCIRNKYIALSKEKQKYTSITNAALENDFCCASSAESFVAVEDMLNCLSPRQKLIMIYKYIYGYSDIEISMLLDISRQAVNRLKNRAITLLREYYIEEEVKKMELNSTKKILTEELK